MHRVFFFALLFLSLPAGAAETMRIAMGLEVAQVVVEGDALRWAEDGDDAAFRSLDRPKATVSLREGRLTIDGAPMPVEAVRFRAGQAVDAPIVVGGVHVRGDVVVLPGRGGVVAVNVLGLEDYLVGVLGSEMPKSFPSRRSRRRRWRRAPTRSNKKLEQYGQPFHLGSSVISQVYKGLEAEDERTREAVEATRGLVLTWQLQPIEAYFHASCGGRTETGARGARARSALPALGGVRLRHAAHQPLDAEARRQGAQPAGRRRARR